MEIKLPLLQKKFIWSDEIEKFKEETEELIIEMEKQENTLDLTCETLDVIQLCYGILDNVNDRRLINRAVTEHVTKLYNRHWKFKRFVNVSDE